MLRSASLKGTFPRVGGALLVLFLLGGCGMFDLRDPETPQGSTVPYVPPTQPIIVLQNIQVSAEAKSTSNFEQEYTADYKWRFDPFDVPAGSPADSLWDKGTDIDRLDQLFKTATTIKLDWIPSDPVPLDLAGGKCFRNLAYRLVLRRSGPDTLFQGQCTIYLRQENTLWKIWRWADVNDGSTSNTWGYAKLPH